MARHRELARTIGGLLAIITLLVLMVLSFLENSAVPDRMFHTLLLLISALLGIDMVRERSAAIRAIVHGAIEGYLDIHSEFEGADDDSE